MGGAQGSMMHPYDNMDLQICDFIDIARQFTQRKIWTEKVDGINITWTYRKGVFYIARNKSQLANPKTFDEYRKTLKGHPAEAQFLKGLRMIEAIGRSANQLNIITGRPQKEYVWANTELIDNEAPQMMKYDEDCLVVHSIFIQWENGRRYNFPIDSEYFDNVFFAIWNKSETKIHNSVKISLPGVAFSYFMDFESKIYEILAECDMTPKVAIGDIVHARVYNALSENLHPENAWMIADNVSQQGKHDIRKIKQSEANVSLVDEYGLSKNRMKIQNRVLRDLKDAWLTFGAKVLEDVSSTLIANPVQADRRMQELFKFNSNFLQTLDVTDQSYLDWCALYRKYREYNVPLQLIEGVVFTHGKYLYKLTGAFQLQNRLTGIARYQYGQTMEENL